VLFDELGEVIEARGCKVRCNRQHHKDIQGTSIQGTVPMASVMKQKPTAEPRYPTSGKIHILRLLASVFLDGSCQ
jgi:hypothetical protein